MSPAILHHFAFDPGSRLARLALGEARIVFVEHLVKPWEVDNGLHDLNPSGMPPVLEATEQNRRLTLCEPAAILGWIEDRAADPVLLSVNPAERAEARRLVAWFDRRFNEEVNAVLLHERMEKPLLKLGPPEARALREGREALRAHLGLLEELLTGRDWLAGTRMSQADLAASAHLSVLDYFGEIAWKSWPHVKTWYMRLKSRPCFRPLLVDRFPGVPPAPHYADLDF